MPRLGDVLASKYRLEQLLGSGGMGHVYRATNEDIGRAVAIKVLRTEHATNPSHVERFLREARAANLVRHPNVVDVLDIGRDADGSPFIVQELLNGRDLLTYVQECGGTLTFAEIVEYVLPVVEAVSLAHAQGVVHRDIKPENVFLADAPGGKRIPKLLDFGISKIRSSIRTTEVGTMMGTPAYMSPEMIQGADADPRSDVWALGIMLFELLAGRYPFDEQDAPALFVMVVTKDMPSLAALVPRAHPDVSRIVERCLRRDPADRYATATELGADLRNILNGRAIEATDRHVVPPTPIAASSLAIPDLELPVGMAPKHAAPTRPGHDFARGAAPAPNFAARAPTELAVDVQADFMVIDRGQVEMRAPSLVVQPPPPPALPAPSGSSSSQRLKAAAPHYDSMPVQVGSAPPRQASRPSASAIGWAPTGPAPADDVSLLVGLAAVGLVGIMTTAVLMTFGHRPDGLPILSFFMKPDATTNLVAQLVTGAIAAFLCWRFARAGCRTWRLFGGKGSAMFQAAVGGAFLFLTIELFRAAF